jgi:hypothetical protein
VNTATLNVVNVSLAYDNRLFRCQVKISDACVLHTQTAVLEVRTSGVDEEAALKTLIYPNPFSTDFVLVSKYEGNPSLEVVDQFGRIIYTQEILSMTTVIQTTQRERGVNTVRIGNDAHRLIKH